MTEVWTPPPAGPLMTGPAPRRRRRLLFWLAVLVAAALVAVGAVIGVRAYTATAGPAGAVRGYFDALARSDAATALAYGTIPAGPDTLLTGAVLREQNRIAPMRDVKVGPVQPTGSKATVPVTYVLAFPGHPQTINARIGIHRSGDDWHLDEVAIPTELTVSRAVQRASVLGAGVPAGHILMFPGAFPISFDTPYLGLSPTADHIDFSSPPSNDVDVEISPAGRAAILAAVTAKLQACLTGKGDVTCPLPGERFIPNSIRGTVPKSVGDQLTLRVSNAPTGELDIFGDVSVQASSYRQLTFSNQSQTGHGQVLLGINAHAYPFAPLTLVWTAQ
jgi:hypothetical protein